MSFWDGGRSFSQSQSASLGNLLKNLFAGYTSSSHFLWKEGRKVGQKCTQSPNNQKSATLFCAKLLAVFSIIYPFIRHVTLKLGLHRSDSSYCIYS